MKYGSKLLLIMMAIYAAVALFVMAFFGLRGIRSITVNEPATLAELTYNYVDELEEEEEAPPEPEPAEEPEALPAAEEAPAEEPAAESAPEPEVHYYRFNTNNTEQGLRIRVAPSLRADIIAKMHPGSRGYVLEYGDGWSIVMPDERDVIGYSYNEYLDLEEITEEAFHAGADERAARIREKQAGQ
ncbi:MAG: SH3 domain-containing protein [Butyrivibrio sp.]|nr:SH3 domain-containing protein [Butyrivibrio sp.]